MCRSAVAEDSMVCCDSCFEWFHYSCVGLEVGSELPEHYICRYCEEWS